MAYKVYISTSSDSQCREYMAVVQRALFSINEFAISALGADTELDSKKQHEMAKQLIQESDIFIGLYDSHYGDVEKGEMASYLEAEYQYAAELNKPMLLFVHEDAKDHAEMRQNAFLEHISTNHVLTYFTDNEDLGAKVKLAIARFRSIRDEGRKLAPSPVMNNRSEAKPVPPMMAASEDELNGIVERLLSAAGDDIEKIVRRALELHSAQE